MNPKQRKKKVLAWILSFMLVIGVVAPLNASEVSAAENALSSKMWSSSIENGLKSKVGSGYYDADTYMCSGFVCWALKNLYDCGWTKNNGVVADIRSAIINKGASEVSISQAKPGDIVTFGDTHIAIVGADMRLYHNLPDYGVVHKYTITEFANVNSWKSGDARVFRGFTQEIPVKVTVNKTSGNPEYTDNNPNYSLKGAVYGIYNGSVSNSNLIKQITTNANGVATATISVKPSVAKQLVIKEISASPGYVEDTTAYKKNGSSGSVTVNSVETPKDDPITVLLYKADAETGKNLAAGELAQYYPQKAGSLAGAVFKITHYKMTEDEMPTDNDYSNVNAASRTWYVQTDEYGYADLLPEYLAPNYDQDDFYMSGDFVTLPIGVITIQEEVAPEGYLINDTVFARYIAADGENIHMDRLEEPIIKDEIKRGDVQFNKAKEDSFDRLANVPFMLTCIEEDGKAVAESERESHIVVSDANGIIDTSANKNSNKTNANDAAWNGSEIDESKLDSEAGVWFGPLSAVKNSKGALPYGTYILDELPCEANEGLTLVKGVKFVVTQNNHVIPIGTLTDKQIELDSVAWDAEWSSTKTQITMARENITIKDRVDYDGVVADEEYTLRGVVMDKETGEPLKVDGQKIESEIEFTAEGKKGNVENKFTFDASALTGKQVVIYEYLLHGSEIIASHEELNDEDQTITFLATEVNTTAIDSETDTNYSIADEEVTITDTVDFANLLDGQQYEMTGTLMDKETKQPLLVNGKKVTESLEFFSNTGKGSKKMTFTFDATGLEGKDIVVFQEITWDGKVVASHKDYNSESQTIHFPGIKTSAIDADTNVRLSNADEDVTITDTVTYWNVMPQQDYKLKGRLVDAETEEEITTATATFTSTESEGNADVTFTFDGSKLAGRNVVVFEELYFDGAFNDQKIAKHIDITDKKQTVSFPKLETSAVDDSTNSHVSLADDSVFIKDTVEFSNVIPGEEYTVEGVAMDKETGEALLDDAGNEITASETFVAEEKDGTVEVMFSFSAEKLAGKSVVIFESLFINGKLIGEHKDIEDEDQTIHFPKIGTTLTDTVSKNHIGLAGTSRLVDTVKFENVVPGYEYELVGFLMDPETKEALLIDGEEVTAVAKFTPEKASGEQEVVFNFDSSSLAGKKVVAYEALLYNSTLIAKHNDIDDFEQSVTFPKIGTTAVDSETNMHISFADDKVTIIDTVSYDGLLAGEEYEMKGYLMDKLTGSYVISDNKPVVATKTFTAEKSSGEIEMEFVFNAKDFAGHKIVAFEELYFEGHLMGQHKDIEDPEQSVVMPKVETKAVEKATGDKKLTYEKGKIITIVDTASYYTLLPGETYMISGTLMDKASAKAVTEAGTEVTAEQTFVAENADGSISLEFTLDMTNFKDKSVVVYEKLYIQDEEGEFIQVGSHEDINDKGQTIEIVAPPVKAVKTGDSIPLMIFIATILMLAATSVAYITVRRKPSRY